jgi:hypothetical protein
LNQIHFKMGLMDNKYFHYILPIGGLIVGLIIGFTIGGGVDLNNVRNSSDQPSQEVVNNLYTSQTATVRGQIKAVNDRTLSVRNTNGSTGNLRASNRIMIVKFNTNPGSVASPSSDLQTIEINKDAVMSLEMVNGNYEVVQIQYIAPVPALPSIAPGEL